APARRLAQRCPRLPPRERQVERAPEQPRDVARPCDNDRNRKGENGSSRNPADTIPGPRCPTLPYTSYCRTRGNVPCVALAGEVPVRAGAPVQSTARPGRAVPTGTRSRAAPVTRRLGPPPRRTASHRGRHGLLPPQELPHGPGPLQ